MKVRKNKSIARGSAATRKMKKAAAPIGRQTGKKKAITGMASGSPE